MDALLNLLLRDSGQDPFIPDFGQREIIDIPKDQIKDLSDE